MKHLLITIALNLSVFIVYSQKTSLSFQAGISFPRRCSPTLENLDYIKKENRKITLVPCIKYKFQIFNHFQLKAGILYEERGWYDYSYTIDPKTGETFPNTKTNFYYSFLTLPTTIQAYLGKSFKLSLGGGLNSSLRLGGLAKANGKKAYPLGNIQPGVKHPLWDISSEIELGINIKLSPKFNFIIEGSHFKSISPIGDATPTEEVVFHKGYMILIGIERNFLD